MNIEVGMYVRTKNGIGKVDQTEMFMDKYFQFHLDSNKGSIHNVTTNTYWNSEEDIIGEPKDNIKKLLQPGDIISYEFPTGLGMISYEKVIVYPELINIFLYGENNHEYIIKRVVTKEQFAAMEHEVK